MAYKILAYISISLFVIANMFLSGCSAAEYSSGIGQPVQESIAGKWENSGHQYEFKKSGRLLYSGSKMNYEITEPGTVKIIRVPDSAEDIKYFKYSRNSDGTLTMNGVNYFPILY